MIIGKTNLSPEEQEALELIDSLVESASKEARATINTDAFVVTAEDVARMEAMIQQNEKK